MYALTDIYDCVALLYALTYTMILVCHNISYTVCAALSLVLHARTHRLTLTHVVVCFGVHRKGRIYLQFWLDLTRLILAKRKRRLLAEVMGTYARTARCFAKIKLWNYNSK